MNTRIALIALAMAVATPAHATNVIGDLAAETGLSKRQVTMIVGNRTPFAEYRTSYSRSLAQFKRVLGRERAERLIAGDTVLVDRHQQARMAVIDGPGNEVRMP